MRLQCPNCDAEYEVNSAAIPPEGRDVQCSNCGHGWFQTHPDYENDYELESALYDPPPPLPQAAPNQASFARRDIDPAALQILREEAALEEAKRAAEQQAPVQGVVQGVVQQAAKAKASPAPAPAPAAQPKKPEEPAPNMPPSTQPADDDLGDIEAQLDAVRDQAQPMPKMSARVTPRRVARLRGEDEAVLSAAPSPELGNVAPPQQANWQLDPGASRGGSDFGRDQASPELAELSTLPPSTAPRAGRKGRRAGFWSAILIGLIGLVAYVFGPAIATNVPALAAPMASYVGIINAWRDTVAVYLPYALDLASGALQAVQAWLTAQGWL